MACCQGGEFFLRHRDTRSCPPRHRTRFELPFHELSYTASYDVANHIIQALPRRMHATPRHATKRTICQGFAIATQMPASDEQSQLSVSV